MTIQLQPARLPCHNCGRLLGTYAGGTVQVRWHQLEVYGVPPMHIKCRHCGCLNVIGQQSGQAEVRTA